MAQLGVTKLGRLTKAKATASLAKTRTMLAE